MRAVVSLFFLFYSLFSYAASLEELSLEQKVGQLFIFGFSGSHLDKKTQNHFKKLQPGSVIVFGRNIKTLSQTADLNNALQKLSFGYSRLPLLIAIDQEGGSVSRIKTSPGLPSAYTIGNTNDPTLSFQAGKVTGEVLKTLGFNMNLAPVLDITDSSLQSFISTRSFSDSPHKVSSMGLAFAQGLEESKVLPVAKHFPGHGAIALDTHRTTPHRQISYQSLASSDLIPFTQFAATDILSGVMVAHIAYPLIDSSGAPATFSKHLVSKILIDDLKYKGLIMTDDLEMAGAAALTKVEDRVIAAFLAGNDLLMLAWSPDLQMRAVNAVIAAVKSGKISQQRLNSSVAKILKAKSIYAASSQRQLASRGSIKESLQQIQFNSIYSDIVSRFFKTLPGLEKTTSYFSKFLVVSPSQNFLDSFLRYTKQHNTLTSTKITLLGKMDPQALAIVHVTNSKQFKALYSLSEEQKKQTVVISSYAKAHFENKSSFLDVVEVFSLHPNLGGFTADAINRTQQNVSLLEF